MVDLVSSTSGRPRIARPGEDVSKPLQATAAGAAGAAAPIAAQGDTVALSVGAASLPEGLSGGPPIDLEAVARIKEKIAEGKYPIDLQAITESLFKDFTELMA